MTQECFHDSFRVEILCTPIERAVSVAKRTSPHVGVRDSGITTTAHYSERKQVKG